MNDLLEIRKVVLTAIFTGLIITGAYIAIPIGPVPIVLANMFAIMAGMLLGPVYGSISVLIYLLLGIMGIPVFSGGKAGVAILTGPTGGYLIGYLIGAFTAGVISLAVIKTGKARFLLFAASLVGIAVIYVPGLAVLKMSLGKTWQETLQMGLYPFIPGALIKIIAAGVSAWVLLPMINGMMKVKKA